MMEYSLLAQRAKALVVSGSWDIRTDIVEYLEYFSVPSLMTDDFDDIPYLYLADYEPSYMFVGVDEFGGPALLYDTLRKLRDSMPNTAIILISSEFSTDEYGTHRFQIADVSLRYPFTHPSLFYALKQAPINLALRKKRSLELVV